MGLQPSTIAGVRPSRFSGPSNAACPAPPISLAVWPLMAALCMGMKWGVTRAFPGSRKRKRRGDIEEPPFVAKEGKELEPMWPDMAVIGNSNFSDEGRGDLMYRDGVGNVMNLTGLHGYG